ncbi:putative histone acetyltransferase HAC-like 1 [Panicum miliaceum]|uniref:Histone acetyltransferase HAC-like 1 n=1 Tax=Panicum miliaceum TaxID=4540 RepID=A0A3L6QFB1_PANMI|nr:putative histone acetyltransferase HAC-like 1 [Panicum miliaceum]
MAAPSGADADQQFVMLRTAMREKIFEYIGRKQPLPEWRRQLPELAKRLEEVLYRKFPNKNDYYNMMKGAVEPHLQFAIKTLSAQNQQIQQNLQKAWETASSSGRMTPVVNHDALCEQSVSLLTYSQNNVDEHNKTDRRLPQHQSMEDMAALSGVDQQFVMLRTAMREKILEYIRRKQSSPEWRKRLPELAKRLEEVLHRKFPNMGDSIFIRHNESWHITFQNLTRTETICNFEPLGSTPLSAVWMLNLSGSQRTERVGKDVNHGDLCEQSATLPADVQNNNADEVDRTGEIF